jgi:hypothetical protein
MWGILKDAHRDKAMQTPVSHTKIASTVRNLGVAIEDAIVIAEHTKV